MRSCLHGWSENSTMRFDVEEWREIPGYEGKYYVSSFGNVKVIYKWIKVNEKILSPMLNKDGYYQVNLSLRKKVRHHRIHRLVAEAFVENPNCYPMVNHKDENKLNNRADNLEWCDQAYNIRYGTRTKRCFETKRKNNSFRRALTKEDANEIRRTCIPYDYEFGIKQTAKKYGVSSTTITNIVHNKIWKNEEEK